MKVLLYKKSHLIGSAGGVEKVLSMLANALTQKGHQIFLATRDSRPGELFFPLNPEVVFKRFHIRFSNWNRFFGRFLKLDKFFDCLNREKVVSRVMEQYCREIQPDVIVTAGLPDMADIAWGDYGSCPVVIMLHSYPSIYFIKKHEKLHRSIVNKSKVIQILFPSYRNAVPDYFTGRIIPIANCVSSIEGNPDPQKTIVYLARIERDKRQDLLIQAFSKIASTHPDWGIHFYGSEKDAHYAKTCREMIHRHHLSAQIHFKGVTDQVDRVLLSASICAFPSAFEGFGLSLAEAMSAGLPCIGFVDTTGVNELIKDGENGFLVSSVDDLAQKLDLLMGDAELRQRMGARAQEMVAAYSETAIVEQWEELLMSLK